MLRLLRKIAEVTSSHEDLTATYDLTMETGLSLTVRCEPEYQTQPSLFSVRLAHHLRTCWRI